MKKSVATTLDHSDSFDNILGKTLGINFGDFDLDMPKDPFNHKSAERISSLLSACSSLDDLGPCAWDIEFDENTQYPQTSIGGCSMLMHAPTVGNIYAMLAHGFAYFAIKQRHELFLNKVDYYHLKTVYDWHQTVRISKHILEPLRKTLDQFRTHYVEYDKSFMLELIKEAE